MSLLARALHACPRPAPNFLLQSRAASTAVHHHDHPHTDNTQYAKEDGFFTPFWRNTIFFSTLVVAFYNFAPARGEDNYVTQYIARFQTPSEVWTALNEKHVNAASVQSDQLLLQNSATRPAVYRYRYPQRLDFVSPHLAPVGSEIDMSEVVAKGSHE